MIVLFVGTVVGAVTGLVVSASFGAVHLAILAGFLGAMAGVVIRNFILAKGAGVGPDDSKTPTLVVIYATVASLAGSLAAKEVADFSEVDAAVGIGALAGLFLAVLLSMLMISYHTTPGEQPKVKKKQ
ncbi:MAG: hypothetical protein WBV18_11310 [Methyloceanibacter sp.]|uniref:hypothetical protein n=1 Tax=Methyloceanibacter sp. TaxID=1965321 RepID=UPI003C565095